MYCGEHRHCFCPPLEGGKREGEGGLGKRKREEGREKKRPKIRAEGEGQFCAPVTPKEGRREEGNINAPRETRRRRRRLLEEVVTPARKSRKMLHPPTFSGGGGGGGGAPFLVNVATSISLRPLQSFFFLLGDLFLYLPPPDPPPPS